MSTSQLLLYGVGALGTLPRGFAKWLVVCGNGKPGGSTAEGLSSGISTHYRAN